MRAALQKQRSVADDIDSLLKTVKWKAFKASWAKKRVRNPAAIPRSTICLACLPEVPQLGLTLDREAVA